MKLAESINKLAINSEVESVLFDGQRFDCVYFEGYLQTINTVAKNISDKETVV